MNYILKLAKDTIKKHNTNDPFELCDEMEVCLHRAVLPRGINGFYTLMLGMPFVYLNSELSLCEQRAVCAHELGHMLLHPQVNTLFVKQKTIMNAARMERDADLFAAALLIPQLVFDGEELVTARQLAHELDVPERLVEARLRMIG